MSFQFSDFYVTGGTLKRGAACYVERQADDDLYNEIMKRNFCYVLTSRQTGKSSLMVRTAGRLREAAIKVIVLDLTAIGQNLTAEQWYDGLAGRIGQQMDLENEVDQFWLDHQRLGPMLRLMRVIRQVILTKCSRPIVIFVDEIDAIRSLPFPTDEFFAGIREFYNRRSEDAELERLSFCLLGVAMPSDLIRNHQTTPFNIGERIELSDFTDEEAAPLLRGLRRRDSEANALLTNVLRWTGGHPYLTQRLCQAVAEDRSISTASGVDWLCESLFLSPGAQQRDDNLLFVRERLLGNERDRAGLLDLYLKVRKRTLVEANESDPLVTALRLSGIVRVMNGCLYVRNQIYAEVFDQKWIESNMPDAERRRQRAAYRRGFVRATMSVIVASILISLLIGFAVYTVNSRTAALEYGRKYATLAREVERLRAENSLLRARRDGDAGNLFFQRQAKQIELESIQENTTSRQRRGRGR
jgi:hypothetical protein